MSQQRILVVEDEAEIAGYLRRGLSFEGYVVETAADGQAALIAARERPPDVIVLDVMLPKIDGFEVAKRIRGDDRRTRRTRVAKEIKSA